MRRIAPLALAGLTLAACSDDPVTMPPDQVRAEAAAATGPAGAATYQVSITNMTETQAFTPPLVAVHRPPVKLFQVGQPASTGLQQIAENGNLGPMETHLSGSRHVMDLVIDVGDPPPLLPGETRSFEITGQRGARRVSWVSMLICTNDGFTGVAGARLPRDVGQSATWHTAGYDAGTEMNTETATDLVPPCGPLSGIHDGSIGTGMSDPDLAEGGVVHHHEGIQGGADLTAEVHGWTDPVASIVVTRIQ